MGQKKNLHTRCPTSSCCFMKGQNKQDKICLIHSSKETGVRNVTHPSPSNSTMWPGAAQPRTETPEAGAPAVLGFPGLHLYTLFWSLVRARPGLISGQWAWVFSDRGSGIRQGGLGAHNPPSPAPGLRASQTSCSGAFSWEPGQPLEKTMAPHSSTLAWKIPWTEEPGGLQSMGSLRVRHD